MIKKNKKLARILKVAENHKVWRKVAGQLVAKLTYTIKFGALWVESRENVTPTDVRGVGMSRPWFI